MRLSVGAIMDALGYGGCTRLTRVVLFDRRKTGIQYALKYTWIILDSVGSASLCRISVIAICIRREVEVRRGLTCYVADLERSEMY